MSTGIAPDAIASTSLIDDGPLPRGQSANTDVVSSSSDLAVSLRRWSSMLRSRTLPVTTTVQNGVVDSTERDTTVPDRMSVPLCNSRILN